VQRRQRQTTTPHKPRTKLKFRSNNNALRLVPAPGADGGGKESGKRHNRASPQKLGTDDLRFPTLRDHLDTYTDEQFEADINHMLDPK
jgi:hypothetical protein